MKPSRDWWAECVWPLVDMRMTRHDCKRWMESMGYPEPPRSSCAYCPFHNDNEWRRLRDSEPKAFDDAVQFEIDAQAALLKAGRMRSVPFLHKSCKPLSEVDFSTDTENGQLNLFQNECLGMCGV
jgi:hypothetical protein